MMHKYHVHALWFVITLLLVVVRLFSPTVAALEVDYYRLTCPMAEKIVRRTVTRAVDRDRSLAPALIRMHFHDCFVRGCDASILLDPTATNRTEKLSPANTPSLRGYEVVDEAKARLESHCPQTVSCADIIAFAARDSACLAGGPEYAVPAGRRDGAVSRESEVLPNLPLPNSTLDQLIQIFSSKGLAVEHLVALSGAHSVGVSHCSSFAHRLYGFNATHAQDPTLDRSFASLLKANCPPSSGTDTARTDPTVPLDSKASDRLDVRYYMNLMAGRGLLGSDQALVSGPVTAALVAVHAAEPWRWKEEFAAAMVRMGSIEVLTGEEGEVRKDCRAVNG
ncbi:Peroxidase 5 [Ananas comosus]|uniref:Peroxidase n=1 Tax=Ananas comosus TaxID=4615 RepID=A0A199UX02_ANACO|nr:Peroxidase 5 [Ananas comosus]